MLGSSLPEETTMTRLMTMSAAALTLLCMTSMASAQDAPSWQGSYGIQNKARAQKQVKAGIEKCANESNFLIRGFVRDALTDSNKVCARLDVVFSGDNAYIQCDGGIKHITPRSGAQKSVKSSDGKKTYKLKQKVSANTFTQIYKGKDGVRTNVYTLNADGSLTLRVKVTSSKLAAPLRYSIKYNRR